MYCSRCRRPLFYKDLDSRGWCTKCGCIVQVTLDRVSPWAFIATLTLAWFYVVI